MSKHRSLIAIRYARALVALVSEKDSFQELVASYKSAFEKMVELFQIKEAQDVLKSPVMSKDLKFNLLELALKSGGRYVVNENFINFIKNILDADRVNLIPEIAEAYEEILLEKRNEKKATVMSARKLPQETLSIIEESLRDYLGKKVLLTTEIDKRLLGGFIVQIENYLLDYSLRSVVESSIK